VPAVEILGAVAAAGAVPAGHRFRQVGNLRRVAAGAPLREHFLATIELRRARSQICRSSGRVLEVVGLRAGEEERGEGGRLRFVRLPEGRYSSQIRDLDRRDRAML